MIEIAIAIGVIAFGLIAVIGILPQGMNSQKENREDTTISQDAPYFLNAIRNGEMRTNGGVLTNFVETIYITNIVNPTGSEATTNVYTYNNPALVSGGSNDILTSDMMILGLLCTPEYDTNRSTTGPPSVGPGITNSVTAIIRAMSGSAVQLSGVYTNLTFRYQLNVENAPWNFFTGYNPLLNPNLNIIPLPTGNQPNVFTTCMTSMLHEVRLKFSWPVLPNGALGDGRRTYRTVISSHLLIDTTNNIYNSAPLYFFEPQSYTNNLTAN